MKRYLVAITFLVVTLTGCTKEAYSNADTDNETESTNEVGEDLETMTVHYIDVGQADAILLEYAEDDTEYNVMIDSGDWNDETAVDYLNENDVSELDLLVGTHPHSDHIGQMDNIINDMDVSEVWMSGDETDSDVFDRVTDAIDSSDADYEEPRTGEEHEVGPLDVEVVSPDSVNGELNNGSVAFRAQYGNVSFMFTGDAEQEAESEMVSSGENLDSDILKLGHHGSDTSSTSDFINEVNPETGVIQVGKDNSYGHPSPSIIDRMNENDVDLYSTADNGTVKVETNGMDYEVKPDEEGEVEPASEDESED